MERISLREMIQNLRVELYRAARDGTDATIKFKIESIELEAQIAVTREKEGGAGLKFWVLDALSGKVRKEEALTHKIVLKLKPETRDGGDQRIADEG